MRARFGHSRCGLQTGDTSLNTDADIVIMTTEILRNIMYRWGMQYSVVQYRHEAWVPVWAGASCMAEDIASKHGGQHEYAVAHGARQDQRPP